MRSLFVRGGSRRVQRETRDRRELRPSAVNDHRTTPPQTSIQAPGVCGPVVVAVSAVASARLIGLVFSLTVRARARNHTTHAFVFIATAVARCLSAPPILLFSSYPSPHRDYLLICQCVRSSRNFFHNYCYYYNYYYCYNRYYYCK